MAWGVLLPLAATLGGICSVAYSLRFIHDVFFNGEPRDLPKPHPHEPPLFMKAPVALLVAVCVGVGLFPAVTFGPLVRVAATAVLGQAPPEYHLALWHGFNLPLLMSVVAVVGGTLLYFGLQRFINLHRLVHLPLLWKKGGRDAFLMLLSGWLALSRGITAALQTGSLQRYLSLLVLMALSGTVLKRLPLSTAMFYLGVGVAVSPVWLGLVAAIEQVGRYFRLTTEDGATIEATQVVNAAGAWADELAIISGVEKLGLQPYRRTAAIVGVDRPLPEHSPMVAAADKTFYFRREGTDASPGTVLCTVVGDVVRPAVLEVPMGTPHLLMTGKTMAIGEVAETTFAHPPLIGDAFVNDGSERGKVARCSISGTMAASSSCVSARNSVASPAMRPASIARRGTPAGSGTPRRRCCRGAPMKWRCGCPRRRKAAALRVGLRRTSCCCSMFPARWMRRTGCRSLRTG